MGRIEPEARDYAHTPPLRYPYPADDAFDADLRTVRAALVARAQAEDAADEEDTQEVMPVRVQRPSADEGRVHMVAEAEEEAYAEALIRRAMPGDFERQRTPSLLAFARSLLRLFAKGAA